MSFKREILTHDLGSKSQDKATQAYGSTNIKSIQLPKSTDVKELKLKDISGRKVSYNEIKKNFVDSQANNNSRFQLNELSKKVMSVEEEELARIEAEVTRRLAIRIEQIQDNARESGYKNGLEQGREEAFASTLEELKPVMDRIKLLLSSIENALPEIAAANEQVIIRIIYQIIRKTLLRDVAEDHEYIKRHVNAIIDRLGTRENIKIFISEQSIDDLEKIRSDLSKTITNLKNVSVDIDTSLSSVGCRVETEFGDIDATIENQLKAISKILNSNEGIET